MNPKVAKELIQIIYFLPKEQLDKIPKKEIECINKIKDNTYPTKINKIEDIKIENLLEKTQNYLAYIFINYLANEKERKEYEILLKENRNRYQKELEKKYDITAIFEKRKESSKVSEEEKWMIVKKTNLWNKLLEKMKRLFKKE